MHIKVIIEHSDYLFIIPASVLGIIIYRKKHEQAIYKSTKAQDCFISIDET